MNINTLPAVVNTPAVIFHYADRPASPRPFGKGILRSLPVLAVEYTADDASWWAAESDRLERERVEAEYNAEIDARFQEYQAQRAYEAGLCFA